MKRLTARRESRRGSTSSGACARVTRGFRKERLAGSLTEAHDRPSGANAAIIALCLSDGDRLDLIQELHGSYLDATVLALTLSVNSVHHTRPLRTGANEVLTKEASLGEIHRAAERKG